MKTTFRILLGLALPLSLHAEIAVVPDKVTPVIPDVQDFQVPDRAQLAGWIGSRIQANEGNRLTKLDTDRLLEGYRKRPGRQSWDGEHVGKWLHAATLAWANTGDPALRARLDHTVAELAKCQLEDGYLGTYLEHDRWTEWDVWAHKYNLIGLTTYMRYTGNLEPMPVCRRMADLLCRTFGDGPGQRDIIKAGQHMGMAPTSVLEPMVLLYRMTGEPRYLDFCKYILRAWEHPNGPKIISTLLTAGRVDKVANGKAYEMLSCLNGALEYYRTVGDPKILEACLNAWKDIVAHRLYLTGAASYREFFHDDFDLPNVSNVGETCVTVTWLQFNAQLLRLTGEARFAEQLERVVLNQLFGAQCPDGTAWGYYVQMQGKKPYSSDLDGHCCLSSGPRGVSLIPTFAMSTDADGVVVNLYEQGTAKLKLRNGAVVNVTTETMYPHDGTVRMAIAPAEESSFALKLRLPAWCERPEIKVNGKPAMPERGTDGYAALRRKWSKGDEVELRFSLEPRVVIGDHKNEGHLAVMFGPLVLAADESLMGTGRSLRTVRLEGATLAKLEFKSEPAPAAFRTWPGAQVFRIHAIVKQDANGPAASDITLVPFADAGSSGADYRVWLPFGPPRVDRNVLMEGVEIRSRKPNAGSIIDDNLETIASTFNNRRAPQDFFGVQLDAPVTIRQVVFAHGRTFHDGGWFDTSTGKPRVQIKTDARSGWSDIGELKDYPATTATDSAGLKAGEKFTLNLGQPQGIVAIRVLGKPSCGDNPAQAFSSCAELQAYAAGAKEAHR